MSSYRWSTQNNIRFTKKTLKFGIVAMIVALLPNPVMALEVSFDIGGRVFMNFLFADNPRREANNNPRQASDYGGYYIAEAEQQGALNGMLSELELNIIGRVSKYVEVGARVKSRFMKNTWHLYWDNRDLDSAQYMKLRGIYVRLKPPDWAGDYLRWVHIGSSDLGTFSPWTVGKVRYIDRDNAAGIFFNGLLYSNISYDVGAVALPSKWAGPGWETTGRSFGGKPYIDRDFAYTGTFNFDLSRRFAFKLNGVYIQDIEVDDEDYTETDDRYLNTVGSLEFETTPVDILTLKGTAVYSSQNYGALRDYIDRQNGYNNVPQKDTEDNAFVATLNFNDPFSVGLYFSFEYFNVGDDFVSMMGARRESDVLITQGFPQDDLGWDAAGLFGHTAQAPTLNVDNLFIQFDEPIYQNIIGWHGGTFLFKYGAGKFSLNGEYTYIDYNTNKQGRDMTIYPTNMGFGFWNNAYNAYQERETWLAILKASYYLSWHKGFDFQVESRFVSDEDEKNVTTPDDDYSLKKIASTFSVKAQVTDEITATVGAIYYDNDLKVDNTDMDYHKTIYFLKADYSFGGVKIGYILEKVDGKYWDRYPNPPPPRWASNEILEAEEWRSRGFLEVAF